jgi:hypothetical protein
LGAEGFFDPTGEDMTMIETASAEIPGFDTAYRNLTEIDVAGFRLERLDFACSCGYRWNVDPRYYTPDMIRKLFERHAKEDPPHRHRDGLGEALASATWPGKGEPHEQES